MKKQIITAAIIFFSSQLRAQTTDLHATDASAGEAVAGGIRFSYSIGEMLLVDTKSSNGLIITQGILQPDPDEKVVSNDNGFQPEELQVYPVPTPDLLSVRISMLQTGNISLALYDNAGRQMINESFSYSGFTTKKYNLAKFATGVYRLKIIFDNGTEKRKGIYSIVKTN